ncbi:MAG: beta-ketoacyl-ACP synthase III [Candidatus Margulisiibacteriota bacterium]|jgi:3-oxoacyl-[acyl-carrier-protein] synthase-3
MLTGKITGTGLGLPKKQLTNDDIAKFLDTSDEWISSRTGIKARYIAEEGVSTSDLAVEAAINALASAKLSPEDLDLIIVATSSPDYINFPSTACIVQDKIKAVNAAAFDLSAACTGFVYALTTANQFIATGMYKNILVIGADTLSKNVNWSDRGICVLFGDGAGAVVLQPAEKGEGILSSYLAADGSGGKHLINLVGGSRESLTEEKLKLKQNTITMDGKAVFKFSTKVIVEGILKVLDQAGLKTSDISLLIPHQANTRIIDHAVEKLGLSADKVYVNIQRYGNTSAATIPIALCEAVRDGKVKKGDVIVMMGFGGGLTWGANVIRW